jgi:YggT family protein
VQGANDTSHISFVLQLYVYVIVAMAVMSWMVAFNVVNLRNPLARNVWIGLNALTEQALRPIRRAVTMVRLELAHLFL